MTGETRLNKELALRLGISRRQADDLIAKGSVSVDGTTAILGHRTTDDQDITVSGHSVPPKHAFEYLAFYKPVGLICSRREQGDIKTIYSTLPARFHHLKPVGRLDKDSSGILLLTNDGDFAHSMTHPSFSKSKIYEVQLDKKLSSVDFAHLQKGVALEDGISQFNVSKTLDSSTYEVQLFEGRNRQIRRTFGSLGYIVTKLHRTSFGDYSLSVYALEPEQWKEISK